MQPVTDPDLLAILNGGEPAPGGPVYGPPPKAPSPPAPPSAIAQAKEERDRLEWEATHNPDGTAKPSATPLTAEAQGKLQAQLSGARGLLRRIEEVQSRYTSDFQGGGPGALVEYLPGTLRPANQQFEDAGRSLMGDLAAAYGLSAQQQNTPVELEIRFGPFIPKPGDRDEVIEAKIARLREVAETQLRQASSQLGIAPEAAQPEQDPAALAAPTQDGGAPPVPGSDMERPYSPADPGMGPATGGTRTVEDNPALAAEYRARLAADQPASEIIPWLRSQGASPDTLRQAIQQIQYRRANPNVPIESYSITSTREEPLSLYDRAANAAGNAELPGGFSPGAYAVGAGQFLSGNTLDNLTSDPERARLSTEVMRAQNPGSTLAGEVSGGIMAGLTGEAGLARLGMAAGLGRGVAADTLAGMAGGAGAADDGNRLMGAVQGGLAQGGGSLAGGGAMRVAGRALNPTGGGLAELYASGVRPSPGQRFADSGAAGRLLNTTEEKLQSLPVVGDAIRGTRDRARDQFQVGAFNEALREIGDALPAGIKPGTDPHRYTQESFRKIYETARSGMRIVADEELASEITQLAPDIQTLGPAMQNRLKAILANTVKDDLSGDAYKRTMSDLGKHIARLSSSTMAEERQLAEILQGVSGALDGAARRHSDPEAVRLLDAADAGYAKLVRIEEAAARRGGEAGTFSPAQFDSAVQRTSGGVRSKAYLRGDAAMQDYAAAGRSLGDYVPNSGSFDRAIFGAGALGAGSIDPTGATYPILAAITAAYAPGVRRATTGALAPSRGKRKAISAMLRKIERLSGATTGALALQGTSPGQ